MESPPTHPEGPPPQERDGQRWHPPFLPGRRGGNVERRRAGHQVRALAPGPPPLRSAWDIWGSPSSKEGSRGGGLASLHEIPKREPGEQPLPGSVGEGPAACTPGKLGTDSPTIGYSAGRGPQTPQPPERGQSAGFQPSMSKGLAAGFPPPLRKRNKSAEIEESLFRSPTCERGFFQTASESALPH